jgi:quercetin dioxygenase-like cupin family protein
MSEKYVVTSIEGLEGPAVPGQAQWHTIRSTLGISAFGINAWTATDDGQQIIGEHDETSLGHEELYLVLSGDATFTLDGETVEAPTGAVVHIPDTTVKRAATGTRGTTILVVGAKPGEAFTPSSWERASQALRFWPTEEWDRAVEVLEGHLVETPDHAGTHYNLACAHARAGRSDVALEHLERAVELQESFAEFAPKDDDLASLREDPRFAAATA